jgi:hypothetical protein
VRLDPQPLPPLELAGPGYVVPHPPDWVMLNPQPLPPRELATPAPTFFPTDPCYPADPCLLVGIIVVGG